LPIHLRVFDRLLVRVGVVVDNGAMVGPDASQHRYAVALSYAREDRPFAQGVARRLKNAGVEVFYDRDQEESNELWGQNLIDALDRIYRLESRFVVIFTSEDYKRNPWTIRERQIVQARALQDPEVFVLPVRLDDAKIPGLTDTIKYLDARGSSYIQIADAILQKIRKIDSPGSGESNLPLSRSQRSSGTSDSKAQPRVVRRPSKNVVRRPPMNEGRVYVADHPYRRHNLEVDWDDFAPDAYWRHNYSSLREDDRAIILAVGEYFSGHFEDHPEARGGAGLDVGSGSNLYPALGMLPWARTITLTDHSAANVDWLRSHLHRAASSYERDTWEWQAFWETFSRFDGYDAGADARALLSERCQVQQVSLFDIEAGQYDIGTMFFVAESMTSYEAEFEDATKHFLDALRPGAPFAAAFMDKSHGYVVWEKSFPAVPEVDSPLVASTLKSLNAVAQVEKIPIPGNDPLRDGYDGMIIAVGTAPA
jgi:TIR domain/NNMT/PNMT/TEMT family